MSILETKLCKTVCLLKDRYVLAKMRHWVDSPLISFLIFPVHIKRVLKYPHFCYHAKYTATWWIWGRSWFLWNHGKLPTAFIGQYLVSTQLYEPHQAKFWQMWARADGRDASNIKLFVMWWLNFISCLIKHLVILWDKIYCAIEGKHRVAGKRWKAGVCAYLKTEGFFFLCSSIVRLTYTQVSCLKGDLISWFSFQNTGSTIFLSLTSN